MTFHTVKILTAEGTGYPEQNYAHGRGSAMCRSPKSAHKIAWKNAQRNLVDNWKKKNNPYGGCEVLRVVNHNGTEKF